MRESLAGATLLAARLLPFIGGPLSAAAAGLGGRRFLVRRNRRHYDREGTLLSSEHAFSGLMPWESALYAAHLTREGTVAVIGCGAGRDLIALARMGRRVEGVELSPVAVERARRHLKEAGVDAPIACADAAEFDFPGKRYGAFLFSWLSYSYMPDPNRRIALLRRLAGRLAPGGCVIATFLSFPGGPPARFLETARRIARATGSGMEFRPGDHFGPRLDFFLHMFTRPEIEAEARAAGLRVACYSDEHNGTAVLRPPDA